MPYLKQRPPRVLAQDAVRDDLEIIRRTQRIALAARAARHRVHHAVRVLRRPRQRHAHNPPALQIELADSAIQRRRALRHLAVSAARHHIQRRAHIRALELHNLMRVRQRRRQVGRGGFPRRRQTRQRRLVIAPMLHAARHRRPYRRLIPRRQKPYPLPLPQRGQQPHKRHREILTLLRRACGMPVYQRHIQRLFRIRARLLLAYRPRKH